MKYKIKEIRKLTGLSQAKFAARYEIPKRTIENWETGKTEPPEYVAKMLRRLVEIDTKSDGITEILKEKTAETIEK